MHIGYREQIYGEFESLLRLPPPDGGLGMLVLWSGGSRP
jgi:hypothetical protein